MTKDDAIEMLKLLHNECGGKESLETIIKILERIEDTSNNLSYYPYTLTGLGTSSTIQDTPYNTISTTTATAGSLK